MKRDWASYEKQLKAKKRQRVDFFFRLPDPGQLASELLKMNLGKNGRPFCLPCSIIHFSSFFKCMFHPDDRTLAIFISRLLGRIMGSAHEFTHSAFVKRRLGEDLDFPSRITRENLQGKRLYFDGVCMKFGRGGYYRSKAYDTPVKYLRIGVFTDELGQCLDFCIGDEHDAEIGMIREKMSLITTSGAEAFVCDGIGAAIDVVVDLTLAGIRPVIRASDQVKAAHKDKPPPHVCAKEKKADELIWDRFVNEQQDYQKWRKESKYSMRWPYSEGYFSSLKRASGETIMSRCPKGIHDEVCLKFMLQEGRLPALWG
ncbi:MAG: hypothetical protein V1728_06410 [Candidatus Micrarchaeota archaeon]